jgi:hypothetical protein
MLSIIIVFNTITLMLDRYPISDFEYNTLENINYFITFVYATEMIIKIFGLGLFRYFFDTVNCIDFIVVVISLVEFYLDF